MLKKSDEQFLDWTNREQNISKKQCLFHYLVPFIAANDLQVFTTLRVYPRHM